VQTYSEASGDFEVSLLTLAQFINIPQNQPIELVDISKFKNANPVDMEASIKEALINRPDLKSARIEEKTLQLTIEKTKSQSYPTVGLSGALGASGNQPDNAERSFSVSLGLSVPIYTGGNIKAQTEQIKTQLKEKRESIKELESSIELDVRSAAVALNSAAGQVAAAKQGVQSAQTTLELTRKLYTSGVSTNVDLVTAQDTLTRAHNNQIRALYNYNLAKANLAKAIGNIENLQE
jgi:outer membrane protein TolC